MADRKRPKNGFRRDRTTRARDQIIIRALQGHGVTPLEMIMAVMNRETNPDGSEITDRQFQAAIAAAPYVHPKLAQIQARVRTDGGPVAAVDVTSMTQAEASRTYARIMAESADGGDEDEDGVVIDQQGRRVG